MFKTFKYIKNSSPNDFDFIICGLVHYTNADLIKKYADEGIGFHAFNFIDRKKSFKDVIHNVVQIFKLARLVKGEKVDILYGHDFFSAMVVRLTYITALLFFFYRIKRVYISIHIPLVRLTKSHHVLNRFLAHFTDRIVCVSNSVLDYSMKTDKIKRRKFQVIYNGIDVNEFSPASVNSQEVRQELGINDGTYVIGSVGNFAPRKGQIYLVKAFNEILEKNPDSLLLIFGSCRGIDGELQYKGMVDRFIEEAGIDDKVRVCTPRLDINKAYSAFDVFVMPSTNEGFGLVLPEAMAMERIVIASDIPPFKEIIDDGSDGFLFRSENYMDLAEKMSYVIKMDESKLKQISRNARNKVLQKFNSETMGREYAKLYDI